MTTGVVYIGLGDHYLKMVLSSAMQLRQLSDIPIMVITDSDRPLPVDSITVRNKVAREIKTSLHKYTPYDATLYLDADMMPRRFLLPTLDHADLCATVAMRRTVEECRHCSKEELAFTLGRVIGTATQFSSALLFWHKTERVDKFFDRWAIEWQRFKDVDQLAFARARGNLVVKELSRSFNSPLDEKETIFHHSFASRWRVPA